MAVNPVRTCPICLQTDDHPRHAIFGGDDPHMDCHAGQGCAVCADRRAGVPATVVGEQFREHLGGLAPAQVEHGDNDDPSDPYNLTTAIVTEA